MTVIHVAVGVIERDGQIFITRRLAHLHQGGKWEFPGGKIEQDENAEQCLSREIGPSQPCGKAAICHPNWDFPQPL